MAAAAAGGVADSLRGLLTGRGSAASSERLLERHGAQLRRHSPRGGGGRTLLLVGRSCVTWWRRLGVAPALQFLAWWSSSLLCRSSCGLVEVVVPRLQLFDQSDVFGGVLVAEGMGGGRRFKSGGRGSSHRW